MSDCTLMDRCRIHTVKDYSTSRSPTTSPRATAGCSACRSRAPRPMATLQSSLHAARRRRGGDEAFARHQDAGGGTYNSEYAFRCYYANEISPGGYARTATAPCFRTPAGELDVHLRLCGAADLRLRGRRPTRLPVQRAVRTFREGDGGRHQYYYRGGSNFDTEVWRAVAEGARARLQRRTQFSEYLAKLSEMKSRGVMYAAPVRIFPANLEDRRRADGLPLVHAPAASG